MRVFVQWLDFSFGCKLSFKGPFKSLCYHFQCRLSKNIVNFCSVQFNTPAFLTGLKKTLLIVFVFVIFQLSSGNLTQYEPPCWLRPSDSSLLAVLKLRLNFKRHRTFADRTLEQPPAWGDEEAASVFSFQSLRLIPFYKLALKQTLLGPFWMLPFASLKHAFEFLAYLQFNVDLLG